MSKNIPVDEVVSQVANNNWQPKWQVMTKCGSPVGITVDDHCFVVLSPDKNGQWHSIKHIPSVAAQLIGELDGKGALNY